MALVRTYHNNRIEAHAPELAAQLVAGGNETRLRARSDCDGLDEAVRPVWEVGEVEECFSHGSRRA